MSDLATADARAAQKKDAPSSDGTLIWYELMTSDQDAAIAYYTAVVGWSAADQTMADIDFRYTILSAGDQPVGGLMELNAENCESGAKPGWIGVIGVPDTDAAARKIVEAGGVIHMGPDEIPNVGRFAVVADPGGAVFELMTPTPRDDAPAPLDRDAAGNFSWHELYSSMGDKAALDFYARQFGWETIEEMDMGPMGTYRIFGAHGVQMGGMMTKPCNIPVSIWGFYVNVDGIDAAAERVTQHGGQVLMGPHPVPGDSWIIQCIDPQGAKFALVSTTR